MPDHFTRSSTPAHLSTHTLDSIDQHQRSIAKPTGARDLAREINVSRRIDNVADVLARHRLGTGSCLSAICLLRWSRRSHHVEAQRHRTALHRDPSFLLILARIEESELPGETLRDDVVGGEEGVAEGGLAVVDMGDDGDVLFRSARRPAKGRRSREGSLLGRWLEERRRFAAPFWRMEM